MVTIQIVVSAIVDQHGHDLPANVVTTKSTAKTQIGNFWNIEQTLDDGVHQKDWQIGSLSGGPGGLLKTLKTIFGYANCLYSLYRNPTGGANSCLRF